MIDLLALAGLALFLTVLAVWARRARTLFELEFIDARLARGRGRMPQRLLDDLLVVLSRNHKGRLVIRCTVERDEARLSSRGNVSPDTLQQIRNLIGMWPLTRLRVAPRIRSN